MEATEREAVEELKRRTLSDVTPKMLEDKLLFYRFCKARDFNVDQAESMLRKTIAWRKEYQIDTLLTSYQPPEVYVKYAPSTFLGFTKDGCLVRHVDGGRADLKGLIRSTSKIDFMKYLLYYAEVDGERAKAHCKKPEDLLLMYMPLFDFEDMSYANATNLKGLQYMLFAVKAYMDNYPERLKCAIVINAPSYFTWAFAIIEKILPSTVKQKLRIYGTDGWKQDLLELMDAADLPAFLGGSKTDPDGNPLCKTFVMRGEPIPESYYMRQGKTKLTVATDSIKLTVLPFSKQEVKLEANEANSHIELEFEVKSGDIAYSVYFQDRTGDKTDKIELVPNHRVDTFQEPEKMNLKCQRVGTYTIVFDNSYSWIHSKEVHYKAKIIRHAEFERIVVNECDFITS